MTTNEWIDGGDTWRIILLPADWIQLYQPAAPRVGHTHNWAHWHGNTIVAGGPDRASLYRYCTENGITIPPLPPEWQPEPAEQQPEPPRDEPGRTVTVLPSWALLEDGEHIATVSADDGTVQVSLSSDCDPDALHPDTARALADMLRDAADAAEAMNTTPSPTAG